MPTVSNRNANARMTPRIEVAVGVRSEMVPIMSAIIVMAAAASMIMTIRMVVAVRVMRMIVVIIDLATAIMSMTHVKSGWVPGPCCARGNDKRETDSDTQ